MTKNNQAKITNTEPERILTTKKSQDLNKLVQDIVDYKFKEYVDRTHQSIEIKKKSVVEVSMTKSKPDRPNSSRVHNRTQNKENINRPSSRQEPRKKEYLSSSQTFDNMMDTEEAKKEQIQKTKKIVIDNLKKYQGI